MTSEASRPTSPRPLIRPRRNRRTPWMRDLVRENALSVQHLIWPTFVQEEAGASAVASMPGVERYGPDRIVDEVGRAAQLGIPAIALFPLVPDSRKSADCAEATRSDNLVCETVRAIKAAHPGIGVICDVALDPYNSLGHDGLVVGGEILNDETVDLLVQQAIVQAEAGCDILAPSDMMDGRVLAMRDGLDDAGFSDRAILAYSAKYASSFYGPFRDAVGSSGNLAGDKKTYQMDPANSDEALREVELDIAEGADMVMVKPGMPYLDILRRVKDSFGLPTFVYQVSGEYAMISAAAERGWLEREATIDESLLAFRRAGADGILTYFAREVAERLRSN
ncbi:MAG: porphobilinogen synthase [Planctomycetota bacterium]|jgi:porphobilinogen synthase